MAEVSSHAPGSFCWVELVANDATAAGRFYQDVFGWQKREVPMGPDSVYTVFLHNGRDAAAMYGRGPDEREGPSHWRSYIAVESADEMTAKAAELGADVAAPPFDVADVGRMAMLRDPSGATVALWQPVSHMGVGVTGEPGAMSWHELLTRDVEAAAKFYTKLFGWDARVMRFGDADYTVFERGGEMVAGMIGMPDPSDAPPNWLPYFGAADCDDRVRAVKSAGGSVFVSPTDIPGVGRFAVLGDIHGAVFAIVQQEGWAS